jgi:hypothetical protein
MPEVMNFVKKVLPWIGSAVASAVPGPIGMAAKIVSGAVGKTVAADPQAIAEAVSGATPDQLLQLKQADNAFAEQMQQIGFAHADELEKIAADDRANARARQVAVRDLTPTVLAFGVTIGFFATLWFVFGHGVAAEARDMANIMVGTLGTAWVGVITYYFGSSAGSDRKTEILAGKQ